MKRMIRSNIDTNSTEEMSKREFLSLMKEEYGLIPYIVDKYIDDDEDFASIDRKFLAEHIEADNS